QGDRRRHRAVAGEDVSGDAIIVGWVGFFTRPNIPDGGSQSVGSRKLDPTYAQLFLAHRAEERRPPGLHDALDGAGAARRGARGTFADVDEEIVLKPTELAGC